MKPIISAEYKTFFKEIKERIYKAQYDALKAVNKELINLYWDIGIQGTPYLILPFPSIYLR